MPRRTYATPDDYAAWLDVDEAPAGAVRALAEATIVVDEMLPTAVYPVDEDGMPTEAAHVAALRDATCAQAAYARAAGDANSVGAAGYKEVQIGSAKLVRGSTSASSGDAPGRHSPTAGTLLQQAGLTGHGPITC